MLNASSLEPRHLLLVLTKTVRRSMMTVMLALTSIMFVLLQLAAVTKEVSGNPAIPAQCASIASTDCAVFEAAVRPMALLLVKGVLTAGSPEALATACV